MFLSKLTKSDKPLKSHGSSCIRHISGTGDLQRTSSMVDFLVISRRDSSGFSFDQSGNISIRRSNSRTSMAQTPLEP